MPRSPRAPPRPWTASSGTIKDVIFVNQTARTAAAFSRDRLADMAVIAGLDRQAFLDALDDPEHIAAVEAEHAEGVERGVNSTPTLFVNGELMRGVPSWEDLSAQSRPRQRAPAPLEIAASRPSRRAWPCRRSSSWHRSCWGRMRRPCQDRVRAGAGTLRQRRRRPDDRVQRRGRLAGRPGGGWPDLHARARRRTRLGRLGDPLRRRRVRRFVRLDVVEPGRGQRSAAHRRHRRQPVPEPGHALAGRGRRPRRARSTSPHRSTLSARSSCC